MKDRFFLKLIISLFATTSVVVPPAVIASTAMAEKQNNTVDNSHFEKYRDDFMTDNGNILRLPLDKNPIPVIIEPMDEQAKEYIVDGIQSLDNISENINYTIFDSKDWNSKTNGVDYIKFQIVDNLEDFGFETAAGVTFFGTDKKTAEITYPINIMIEKTWQDGYWDETLSQSVLTTIAQHELMHTLGFADLYKPEDKQRSVMYYAIEPNGPRTYTDEDVEKIRYCYDGQEIATATHPEYVQYSSYLNDVKNYKPKNEKDGGMEL